MRNVIIVTSCKSIKKPVSILLILLLTLLLSPLAALVLLRTAPVQTYLARSLASYMSKELKTRVEIGEFRLNWFLEAVITDIRIVDQHNKLLLGAKKIRADVKTIDLGRRELVLNEILLDNADVNLAYYKADSTFNLNFILDYFSTSTPSSAPDTTPGEPWVLKCSNLKILQTHFSYRDEQYMAPTKGIDFSDMDFSDLNLEVKNMLINGDTIQGDIRQLTASEKCGFRLNDFTTQFMLCPRGLIADKLQITTLNSRLSANIKFEYDSWNGFNEFIDSVRITAQLQPSQLDMHDIVAFAPDIDGMAEVFNFSGSIKGTVASFKAKDFQFKYGNNTSFKGNINLNGLPNIEETFINLKIDEFQTSTRDIQAFTLPGSDSSNKLKLPLEITRLGNIKINGRFTGFYNDFVSKATFFTDAGVVTTDILLSNNRETKTIEYNGKILIETFDVGKVLDIKQIGTLSMYANVVGKNFSPERADLTLKGEITNLQYEGNTIGLINIDGAFRQKRFSGGIYINDEILGLDFLGSADFSKDKPAFNFQADILDADLVKLNLMPDDSIALLSTSANFNFSGNSIDDLFGSLEFKNTRLTLGAESISMKNLSIATTRFENGGKHMEVNSDFVNATFSGQYTFEDMSDYMKLVFTDYLPSLSAGEIQPERINKGSFDYTISLHNTDLLTAMFTPWLKVSPNTVISGTFDPQFGKVNINGKSPLIVVEGFALHNWLLTGSSVDKSLAVKMECTEINTSESPQRDTTLNRIEQFRLLATAARDSIKFGISWDDFEIPDHSRGIINGSVSFTQNPRLAIHIDNAEIMINDTVWKSTTDNLAIIDSSYFEVRNFGFLNKDKYVILNGSVSKDPLSQLVLDVHNFDISQADILTAPYDFDLDGLLDGQLVVSDLYSVPRVSADLKITSFGFNHENLGDAALKSYWDNRNKLIAIDMQVIYVGNVGTHYPVSVLGNIYPERKHDNFDLKIAVDNIKMKTFEPFLVGIFSRVRGYASGALTMTGDFSDPVLKGKVNLMRSELLVDYLRTSYSFTGEFNFDKDLMWFENIKLTDTTMSTGLVSGKIMHKAFADWALDITLDADKLSALNTAYNPVEMFYGRAKATGRMTLKGPIDNLVMKANVRSEKGTSIFIPISFSRSISENDFIRYRRQGDSIKAPTLTTDDESVLSLQLGLDVTRNADLGIILPYNMGTIDVRGDGLINMGIDTRGDYSMFGQYVMDNGDFTFNFENILKKTFQIQKGGTITFNGSPFDANINLQANYRVKTSLSGLPSLPDQYKNARVNVNCVVSLTNDLYNPDIKFSISLPDATDELKRIIFTNIDTTNSLEMNQQMISLLVLNTFSSTSGISSSSASLGISSYEILSAQLSRMLSTISKDFDIGVNYRPGDQISPQELEVALSTQLFDNRVTIDGAVGMNTYNDANKTTQIIGDVNVEVNITEDGRFRVKAFNRTNTALEGFSDYSPYTQGVGLVFRKEFTQIGDLFKRAQKKEKPAGTTGAKK